jgi:uncharacterized protein YeaO (DUF488 family)
MVKIKRVYEPASEQDGYRILVDRLWPRGLKKSSLVLDEWAKELAPSTGLRKEFGHDPAKWGMFRAHFRLELRVPEARKKIELLAKRAERSTVTLLYSTHDPEQNNAAVLKGVIDGALKIRKAA